MIHAKTKKTVMKEYNREVARQQNPYAAWIEECEESDMDMPETERMLFKTVFYEEFQKEYELSPQPDQKESYVLFQRKEGELSLELPIALTKAFADEKVQMVYCDEDRIDCNGIRKDPWFKPDWSPDTLESFFYFGNCFAIRKNLFHKITTDIEMTDDYMENIRTFVGQAAELVGREAICHVDKVLFHRTDKAEIEEEWNEEIKKHKLFKDETVSIIIPSKDNVSILKTCIHSIVEKTKDVNYEMIVVDNGSTLENQKLILQMKEKYRFSYLYVPMEFNFSKMCNLGVASCKGSFVLLLNDDIEIIQDDWLALMLEKAAQKHVGAVGAKLLYPESDLIQHIGVTNLAVGPAHKLEKMPDHISYYHGVNRGVRNVSAVTGACLLVEKGKYLSIKGLCEELKIAYNDVDLCFKLYEKGFYNVQRNDVILFHHESFTRGNDRENQKKYERLLSEKDKLYERHADFYKWDPFYSRHLVTNSPFYECNVLFAFEDRQNYVTPKFLGRNKVKRWNQRQTKDRNAHYAIDYAGIENKLETKEKAHNLIEGWAVADTKDNALYETYILLENEMGNQWLLPSIRRRRKDVTDLFLAQELEAKNIELSGFAARFRKDVIPTGCYRIGIYKQYIYFKHVFFIPTDYKIEIE